MIESLNKVNWDENGLIPVIAQDDITNRILMFAWMNREALERTIQSKQAVYFSRSRRKLWHKGEESGHFQRVVALRLDCDQDVILLRVVQEGGIACHTGRHSCFYDYFNFDSQTWVESEPILKDPEEIYDNN